jgi:hypothetical protein
MTGEGLLGYAKTNHYGRDSFASKTTAFLLLTRFVCERRVRVAYSNIELATQFAVAPCTFAAVVSPSPVVARQLPVSVLAHFRRGLMRVYDCCAVVICVLLEQPPSTAAREVI